MPSADLVGGGLGCLWTGEGLTVTVIMGVPDKYAMKRLGQSSPNMIKDVYQHLYAEKEKEIAESMKNKFSEIYDTKYDTNQQK